tara:strand:- start:444 stop:602 length:159 start_codon:yes stop_codon:yes gene_type:complete
MISKTELANVVQQVNSRFDFLTDLVNELEAQVKDLQEAKEPATKTTKAKVAA